MSSQLKEKLKPDITEDLVDDIFELIESSGLDVDRNASRCVVSYFRLAVRAIMHANDSERDFCVQDKVAFDCYVDHIKIILDEVAEKEFDDIGE